MRKKTRVIKEIEALANSRVNDAVWLAFMGEEELGRLEELDLAAVTEFKRSSNGTVELKFIDRLAALQWLAERAGGEAEAARLYRALEKNGASGQEENE